MKKRIVVCAICVIMIILSIAFICYTASSLKLYQDRINYERQYATQTLINLYTSLLFGHIYATITAIANSVILFFVARGKKWQT